jgi:hypothetical protein
MSMPTCLLGQLITLGRAIVRRLHHQLSVAVRPAAAPVAVGALGDLARSRPALVAESRPLPPVELPTRAPVAPAPLFVVLSRGVAKHSHLWRLAVVERPIYRSGAVGYRHLCCPECFAPITDVEGIPLTHAELGKKKRRYPACGGQLWTADAAPPPVHAQGRPIFPSRVAHAADRPARVGPRK